MAAYTYTSIYAHMYVGSMYAYRSTCIYAWVHMDAFPKTSGVKFDILALKSLDGLIEVNSLIKEIGING
jgi:hypothetical protein